MTDYINNPICPDSKYSNRVSTVLCINALDQNFDPFVIVPSLKNLPFELIVFNFPIASQTNGWITKHL